MIRHVPNLLSALRLLAAPLAAWLIHADHDTAALLIFTAAGASDGLDGFIARRWGVTSDFGAWLDPAADKLLMLLCLIALCSIGASPVWLLLLVASRDLAIAAGWLMIKLLGLPFRTRALFLGKLSTVMQVLYIFASLLLLAFDLDAPRLMLASAWICAGFTAASAIAYAGVLLRAAGRHVAL
ncbi:MAG: CDP-alcohol phosphatidyltransferase family protein [Alphaproteobacteria bacterium]|nr:CDP-alcohol phosphatidyltransferase family protein [Alphaproteobacteria bacterium]